jgi:hypothetical protein
MPVLKQVLINGLILHHSMVKPSPQVETVIDMIIPAGIHPVKLPSQDELPILVNLSTRLPNISRLSRWAIC